MKNQGFTLVELVVACTLLLLLSTVATTSTYNFVHAAANLKAQYNNVQNIMALHSVLVNAKINYATDLAYEANQASKNNNSSLATDVAQAITTWDGAQNDSAELIAILISPGFPGLPLTSQGGSYLPTSRSVQVVTYVNGNPVTSSEVVPITDINSLLEAYQLTDNGTPTGNIVATITLGTMLDLTANPITRPTLPIVDFESGTQQEIRF
jgi:prepilin-type N-terminal cleavage/methylation domain-containing protein